jgi:hypothetical protein
VSDTPKFFITIILYIIGIMLVMTAILIVLKGLGWLTTLPTYAIWALVLFSIGAGIIGGVHSDRNK